MPFDGPDGYVAGLESLASIIAPKRPLAISEWSQRFRYLSGKASAEPGRWRNERIPFLAGVMDALDWRHPAPLVVFVASSQVGKTEVGINWIGRTVHQCPATFLALFPTDKVARKYVRLKLDPAIAATPVLRQLIPLGRKMNAGNTVSEKHYPGGAFITGSAGISDDMATVSVAYLLLEEVDRMPLVLEGEGDPVELALRRLATYPRSKAFANSTPTTAETSRIWPMWLASTMDRYFVPCVHCNAMQFLRFAQLKWSKGKTSQAAYECVECSRLIEERHKTEILYAGAWRPTHPEREALSKGFHVNGLYTPIGLGDSWTKHADAIERADGSLARMQVVANTRMGETHQGERRKVEWEAVKRRAEPYRLRTIPKGVLRLTSFTDVQADRVETQVLGHGRNEKITVVDYVVHYGDTSRLKGLPDPATGEVVPSPWEKLDAYLAQPIANSCGIPMGIACAFVDSGYLPDVVKGFTRPRKSRGIYATRGSTKADKQPVGKPTKPDVKRKGKTDERLGAEVYELGVSVLKHWLYELLLADDGTEEKPVRAVDQHFAFSSELPDEYYKQLTAEIWDPREGWIERANYHRNEALDTFIGARAAALHHSVAVHRMRELDWKRYEDMLEPADGKAAKPDDAPRIENVGKVPVVTRTGFMPTRAVTK